jgi:hypothetical protein
MGCAQIRAKIEAFEKKYRERYVIKIRLGRDQAENVIKELEVRGRMIEEIRAKVNTYEECIKIVAI